MSALAVTDSVPNSSSASAKSRKNKKKKKPTATKAEAGKNDVAANGTSPLPEDAEADEPDEPDSPTKLAQEEASESHEEDDRTTSSHPAVPNGSTSNSPKPEPSVITLPVREQKQTSSVNTESDTTERLDALAKERDSLLAEVAELRKSLETIQEKHSEELNELREQLEETQTGKDHAEMQYRNLLGKVNTIKSQLGERLKSDAEDLAQARSRIEELEEENRSIQESNESLSKNLSQLRDENTTQASEISTLRGRASLSQQNWVKERDELIQREAYAREEFETAKQAMQDWEVLAMEERLLRETLSQRVNELEEQAKTHKDAYEKAAQEVETQSTTVDGLQRALHEIQDARKRELRELVEQSQSQLEDLRKQLQTAEEASALYKSTLEDMKKELERALPFEKEVKEKNLLIGKLRHEAVILNDHLTKALRMLKKGKPEDNVDRQIITNYFLHFLALDRSDPKKFEALQLIAALLNWTDEQRETAGLARPGTSFQVTSLRLPSTPFRRAPSTPSLSSLAEGGPSKESLAELWKDFLEQEAGEGSVAGSRRPSTATSPPIGERGGSGKGLGIM